MKSNIDDFMTYLSVQKMYSTHTLESYYFDVMEFYDYLCKEGIQSFDEVDYEVLKGYLGYLYERQLEATTMARKLSSLRSFYDFLVKENNVKQNPLYLVHAPKKIKKTPDFLFVDEMNTFIDGIDTSTPLGLRNRAMVELMYASGLRASEVVSLEIKDIDFDQQLLKILGKGQKERYVPFHELALEWLQRYVTMSRPLLCTHRKNDHFKVFVNKNGDPMTTRGLRDVMKRLGIQSDLAKPLHPHEIRHSFATHLLDAGADLRFVQALLGHENLSTTEVYTHISKEKIKHVYLESHPLEQEYDHSKKK